MTLLSPFAREHCDGSRFIQAVVDQDFAARSVQTGHLDGVAAGVGPVHVPGDPVYSQSICGFQTLADHRLHATAVKVRTPEGQSQRWTIYEIENDILVIRLVLTDGDKSKFVIYWIKAETKMAEEQT